ncbi:DUF5906 domain-containing protein [Leptolyngbya sp. FACHB-17]|uniref:DUF5906 domain-containing protein n=1 Tax=unclassified Leptolyngbya TaxID=2650499 RepID=UPI00168065B2|nr:bifunctional DNA primase/polymerase [Leptolyngbya sp. FACHB-17]
MAIGSQTLPFHDSDIENANESNLGQANERISTDKATEIYSRNPGVQATIEKLLSLGLPPIPVAPETGFVCGKAPSYISKSGKTKLLKHSEFHEARLPNRGELSEWFADPRVGVGTFGNWSDIVWIDFDRKNYQTQEDCDSDLNQLLDRIPDTWIERSGAGGYHVAVKCKAASRSFNFAISENGAFVGEILHKGKFCVLAPTIHPNGKPYERLSFCQPCEVESLESIGIFPVKTGYKPTQTEQGTKPIQPAKVQASDFDNVAIDLIPILAREHQDIFTNGVSEGNRNKSAYKLACDLAGVNRWVIRDGYSVERSPRSLWDEALTRFNPPLDTSEAEIIWQSMEKRSDYDPVAKDDFKDRLKFQLNKKAKIPSIRPKKAPATVQKQSTSEAVPHWILSARSGEGLPLVEKISKTEGTTYLLPSHAVAVQYTLERYKNKVGTNGHSLYWLNESKGIFERVSISKIDPNCKARLTDKLTSVLEQAHPQTAIPLVSQNWMKGFRDLFISLCEPITFYTGKQYFPCKNGVLDVYSKTLHTYQTMTDKGIFFDWQSCADYDPAAKCPSMMQWLTETLSDADNRKLRACAYATLLGLNYLKILVELVGERDTGKSVFQRVMIALVSPEKHKALEMRKVNENNFTLSNLLGKKIATIPDTKGFVGSPDTLKRLSGLDTIDAEGKNKDAFDMVFPGIIWIAGNDLIKTADDDDAFQSRRIVLRFPNTVPQEKQKPLLEFDYGSGNLSGVFASELSGILNWIINLGENEAIDIIKGTKSDKTQYTQTLLETNTIAQWLDQNCLIGFDESCVTEIGVKGANSTKYLYANYLQYCEENGHKHPVAIQKFKSQVLDICNKTQDLVRIKAANPKSHGTRSVLVGLSLIQRNDKGDPDVDQLMVSYHPLTGKPADQDVNRFRQMELAALWIDGLKQVESVEQTAEKLEILYDHYPLSDEGTRLMKLKLTSKQKQLCKSAFETDESLRILRDAVKTLNV